MQLSSACSATYLTTLTILICFLFFYILIIWALSCRLLLYFRVMIRIGFGLDYIQICPWIHGNRIFQGSFMRRFSLSFLFFICLLRFYWYSELCFEKYFRCMFLAFSLRFLLHGWNAQRMLNLLKKFLAFRFGKILIFHIMIELVKECCLSFLFSVLKRY